MSAANGKLKLSSCIVTPCLFRDGCVIVEFVKITLTAKLKLTHSPEEKAALDRVSFAFRDAMNFASQAAFELGKTTSANKIHKAVYRDIREQYKLASQMACSVSRYVGATYQAQWTKFKDHQKKQAFRVERGLKARHYKGLDNAPKFVSRTLTYQYTYDYSFKKNQKVSILTLEGRLVLPFEGYRKHLDFIAQGAEIGAGKLWYDKPRRQYYLLVVFTVEVPDPQPSDHRNVVGVDVGQRYHAVVTDTSSHTQFFSGKETNHFKNLYAKVKKSLQRKGTRAATRRLVAIGSRERRFIADRNHNLSTQILTRYPQAIIGLENLTDIRSRTEGRSSKKSSKKARKARKRRSQWSFAELQSFVAYKAPLYGSMAIKVDANYTSQMCVKCGHTSKENRPQKGLMFRCQVCGYECHSDLLGAKNVVLRTLLVRQDWTNTGRLSYVPDVSDGETKAERLQRYSELRWSLDTSPGF